MGYWKSKVLPKIKKVFDKGSSKKAAAAEACKALDASKEETDKVFEEKKAELEPKVLEIYEASSTEVKTVVKERTDAGVKKHSTAVNKFLEELVKIEFPGAKAVSEASTKFGPALVSGPVFRVFEQVAVFLPEEKPKEPEPAAPAAEEAAAPEAPAATEREVVLEEEKEAPKEETPAAASEAPPPEVPAPEPVAVAEVPAAAAEPTPAPTPPAAEEAATAAK